MSVSLGVTSVAALKICCRWTLPFIKVTAVDPSWTPTARLSVIGIASGVAITRVAGPLPLITPQSDIGMVTPISIAVIFLEEIKKGHIKWNGVLDFSINSRLEKIRRAAFRGQWEQALIFAKERLGTIREPTMYLHTGILQFALGNDPEAQRTLGQAASMDSNDNYSRLVLFLIDWLANKSLENRFRSHLLALDWRSEDELIGFLRVF